MFNISNNNIITINRGDSFTYNYLVSEEREDLYPVIYRMSPNDKIYFGLMEPNRPFEKAIVRLEYTYLDQDEFGRIPISFRPEDSEYLLPGLYYYSIKLVTYDEEEKVTIVNTLVQKTKFIIQD